MKTFMQKYREWSRSEPERRATLDKAWVEKFGYRTCKHIERYDEIAHGIKPVDIHRRILCKTIAMSFNHWNDTSKKISLMKFWKCTKV